MTEIIHTKTCSKCQIEKTLSEFYKDKNAKDGRRNPCKTCDKKNSSKYKAERPEEIKAYHKEYHKDYNKKYQKTHKEELQSSRDANKEKQAVYDKKRYQANSDEIKKQASEYKKTDDGKESNRKSGHKYRALKFNATIEEFSPIDIFKRDGYICQLCKKKTRPGYKRTHPLYPHLDHIQPLSLGGAHSKQNVQCLCAHCNLTKSNTGIGDQLRIF